MSLQTFSLSSLADTEHMGACLARAVPSAATVYLVGDLGAGKTTLVRAWLQALGHQGAVKSPTYTLVEPYALASAQVNHFDLYRLMDPEELELMGYRDYFGGGQLTLVEWPSKGDPLLPTPDLRLELTLVSPEQGEARLLRVQAETARGKQCLEELKQRCGG